MKIIKKCLIFVVVVGVLMVGGLFLTKGKSGEFAGIVDRFNPLVSKTTVYIKAPEKAYSVNEYGTARYILSAADDKGRTREVDFTSGKKMTQGIYVRISNKGAYVEEIEKVEQSQVPAKALKKLQGSTDA